MFELSELGHAIKEMRLERGLTQQQLADLAGVGINFIYQLEKNKPSVQLDSVVKVLNALSLKMHIRKDHDFHTQINVQRRPDPWLSR